MHVKSGIEVNNRKCGQVTCRKERTTVRVAMFTVRSEIPLRGRLFQTAGEALTDESFYLLVVDPDGKWLRGMIQMS